MHYKAKLLVMGSHFILNCIVQLVLLYKETTVFFCLCIRHPMALLILNISNIFIHTSKPENSHFSFMLVFIRVSDSIIMDSQ